MNVEEALWYVAASWSIVFAGIVALIASTARRSRRLKRQLREAREAATRQAGVHSRPAGRDDARPPMRPPS